MPKHEHYFFPKQYNNHYGTRRTSFFGFDPSVSLEEIKERLSHHEECDTRILELSRAFEIQLDTGWFTPAGVVHAPASLCTYEPQWNSDVMALWENVVGTGEIFDYDWLSGYLPEGKERDLDAIVGVMDWKENTRADYREKYFRAPMLEKEGNGWKQEWIAYGNDFVAAKRLTVEPGQEVNIQDQAAYGCLVIQGHGKFGVWDCESPTLIRYGQLTRDEFYVSNKKAKEGVLIKNLSPVEPLVILKHFGPDVGIPAKPVK